MRGLLNVIICFGVLARSSPMREPHPIPSASGILLMIADETGKLKHVLKGSEETRYLKLLGGILDDQIRTAQEMADALPDLDHCLQELAEETRSISRPIASTGYTCVAESFPSLPPPLSSSSALDLRNRCVIELFRAERLLYIYEAEVEFAKENIEHLRTLHCLRPSDTFQVSNMASFMLHFLLHPLFHSAFSQQGHPRICSDDFASIVRELDAHTRITTLAVEIVQNIFEYAGRYLAQMRGMLALVDTLPLDAQELRDNHGLLKSIQ